MMTGSRRYKGGCTTMVSAERGFRQILCLLPLLSCLCVTNCQSQEVEPYDVLRREILALGFTSDTVRQYGSDQWQKLRMKANEAYCVSDSAGHLRIWHPSEQHQCGCPHRNMDLQLGRVKFTGYNTGEWGGFLLATAANGRCDTLLKDNIVALAPRRDTVYVFCGLTHLGATRGAVYRVCPPYGRQSVTRVTLLPDAAVDVLPTSDGFLIPTHSGVASLYLNGFEMLTLLCYHQFWAGLYASSAIRRGNAVVIAFRTGVALLVLGADEAYKVEYFSK
jgi:hypothetical protein